MVSHRRPTTPAGVAARVAVLLLGVASLLVGLVPDLGAQTTTPPPTVTGGPSSTPPTTVVGGGTSPATTGADALSAGALPPLSARFEPPAAGLPEQSAEQLSVEIGPGTGSEPITIWVIRFATGFALPADGYRVSVVAGDPSGEQSRVSMLASGGAPTGTYERGGEGAWELVEPTGATFDAAGIVKLESPDDPAFQAPESNVWVTIESPTTSPVQSPVFSVASLTGISGADPVIGVGHWGTVADDSEQPTGEYLQATDGPAVALRDTAIVFSVPSPPSGDLRGNAITGVVDRIWFGPGPSGGTLPYAISVNQLTGEAFVFDFTTGFPVGVGLDPATWIVQGFPPAGTPPGPFELIFNLQALADQFGFSIDDPTLGIGIDRTVALVDGRLVGFAGATGLVGWFQGTSAPTLEPLESDVEEIEAPPAPAAAPAEESDRTPLLVGGAVVLVILLVVAAWALVVRRRSRPDEDPDQKEGRQPHAAGVSPDDALAALSRTVDEVSAKIDARPPTRIKTVSPPTPGSDRARAEAPSPSEEHGERF